MTKTAQDLAEEVLLELGVADASNPAESGEDIALVKRRYSGLYLGMKDAGTAFWDEDSIPERVFIPLAQHVAFSCRNPFGILNYQPIDDEGRTPKQQLKALSSRGPDAWPVQAEYF